MCKKALPCPGEVRQDWCHSMKNGCLEMPGNEEEVAGRNQLTKSYVNDYLRMSCLGTVGHSFLLETHSPVLP